MRCLDLKSYTTFSLLSCSSLAYLWLTFVRIFWCPSDDITRVSFFNTQILHFHIHTTKPLLSMRSFAVLALSAAAVAAPHQIRQISGKEASRAAAVKEAFEYAWDGYYKYEY